MILKIAQVIDADGQVIWHYFDGFTEFTHNKDGHVGTGGACTGPYYLDHNFERSDHPNVCHVSFGNADDRHRRIGFACLAYLCNDRGETIQRIDARPTPRRVVTDESDE